MVRIVVRDCGWSFWEDVYGGRLIDFRIVWCLILLVLICFIGFDVYCEDDVLWWWYVGLLFISCELIVGEVVEVVLLFLLVCFKR